MLMIGFIAISDSPELLKQKFSALRNLHIHLVIFVLLVPESHKKPLLLYI